MSQELHAFRDRMEEIDADKGRDLALLRVPNAAQRRTRAAVLSPSSPWSCIFDEMALLTSGKVICKIRRSVEYHSVTGSCLTRYVDPFTLSGYPLASIEAYDTMDAL
jgi:hypothetical protein